MSMYIFFIIILEESFFPIYFEVEFSCYWRGIFIVVLVQVFRGLSYKSKKMYLDSSFHFNRQTKHGNKMVIVYSIFLFIPLLSHSVPFNQMGH